MDSDLEIVQSVRDAQAGRPEGIAQLYERYTGRLWSHVYRRCGDRVLTDDITMDVWEIVLAKIGTFQPEKGQFVAWLFQIADNRTITLSRRAGVNRTSREMQAHMLVQGATEASREPGPEEVAVSTSEAERLLKLVRALPRLQREAVMLTQFDGLSPAEAAAVLGRPAVNVRVALHKGLRTLRNRLGAPVGGNGAAGLRVEVVVTPHSRSRAPENSRPADHLEG